MKFISIMAMVIMVIALCIVGFIGASMFMEWLIKMIDTYGQSTVLAWATLTGICAMFVIIAIDHFSPKEKIEKK